MFLRPQEIDTDYQLGACMGPRNGAMRDSACGGKHGAVVRLVRGVEVGRHRERRRINERNQQFPSCFCISRFVAIDL